MSLRLGKGGKYTGDVVVCEQFGFAGAGGIERLAAAVPRVGAQPVREETALDADRCGGLVEVNGKRLRHDPLSIRRLRQAIPRVVAP